MIGGDGFIGRNILASLRRKNMRVLSTSKNKEGPGEIKFCLGVDSAKKLPISNINNVILCAAKTSTSFIDKNEIVSNKINVESMCDLITYFKNTNIKILFLSSDAVFNVDQKERNEFSKPCPSSIYGKQKYAVEQFLLDTIREQAMILRLTKVLSKVSPVCQPLLMSNKEKFKDFTYKKNYFFAPITLQFCIKNILKVLEFNRAGVYHLSNEKIVSSYGLFYDLALRLKTVGQNKRFFKDSKDDDPNEPRYKGYLSMENTSKNISVGPEDYTSLVEYLAK